MIIGVAILLSDDRVYSIRKPARHPNLFSEYNESARSEGWDFPWVGLPAEIAAEGEQGFITDSGHFLDRRQAAQHAFECGQIPEPKDELFSEDVW